MTLLAYILIALQVADGVSTYLALRGGAVERMWLMRLAIERFDLIGGILAVKVPLAGVAVWLATSGLPYSIEISILVAIIYAGVVANNIYIWRKQ